MEKNVDIKGIAGVSIVEIMISLVLVALALIAVSTVFPNMAMHRKGIHEAEQAKMIAAEALEFLQYYDCVDVKNDADVKDEFNSNYAGIDRGSANYTVIIPLKNKNGIDNPSCGGEINTIDVIVTWTKAGKPHNITLTGALR